MSHERWIIAVGLALLLWCPSLSSGSMGFGWTLWLTTAYPPEMESFCLFTRLKAQSFGVLCWRKLTLSNKILLFVYVNKAILRRKRTTWTRYNPLCPTGWTAPMRPYQEETLSRVLRISREGLLKYTLWTKLLDCFSKSFKRPWARVHWWVAPLM